ncbi:hypothetical protein HYPBUDRAFT_152199 [Hyphopichia burtonii NRRL Y-1933]|uniref:Uncharacterized protein n=1 Tax=Hyphopichia burtonii NRRL Y-1933 TaxID=984485 RepID=A0A1E4RNU5_9ASCO|nr:hypothetical protein HYPBUDRAFT_152199 [Hyphopichia burtonii NRRL Y-1933]ODV68942.1 hypothetical protein HYPBUDRAFT_152199 [Hyphopichia burtonii NRRL Y-1933]
MATCVEIDKTYRIQISSGKRQYANTGQCQKKLAQVLCDEMSLLQNDSRSSTVLYGGISLYLWCHRSSV